MKFEIIKFGYDEIARIEKHLKFHSELKDYKHLFSSKEWILSYINVYKPKDNLLIQDTLNNPNNYFVLNYNGKFVSFLGYPFNDYNAFYNLSNNYEIDLIQIIKLLKKENHTVYFDNLFEAKPSDILSKHADKTSYTISMRLRITENTKLSELVSKKIQKMYRKNSSKLFFERVYAEGSIQKFNELVDRLLILRLKNRLTSNNASINLKFNNFIKEVLLNKSLHNNTSYVFG